MKTIKEKEFEYEKSKKELLKELKELKKFIEYGNPTQNNIDNISKSLRDSIRDAYDDYIWGL